MKNYLSYFLYGGSASDTIVMPDSTTKIVYRQYTPSAAVNTVMEMKKAYGQNIKNLKKMVSGNLLIHPADIINRVNNFVVEHSNGNLHLRSFNFG